MNTKEKQDKFMAIVEPIKSKLFMYALALEKNRDDAKDLVGEALLACYEVFDKIEDYSLFGSYVFKTLRNKYLRKKRRRMLFGIFDEVQVARIPSQEPSPELPLDIEMLYAALAKLPSTQREAVVLYEINGFSQKEIAEIQGCTVSAVKSKVKRGKEHLQRIIIEKENYGTDIILNAKVI